MEDKTRELNLEKKLNFTTDYAKFVDLAGNRTLDKGHVKSLKAKMEAEGNLTPEFPIVVNESMEVIDGQHRIAALKELDYPVYYVIEKGLNLGTVRQINLGRRNWTWRDYASSYAKEGNQHYKDLLDFSEMSGLGKYPLMTYCNYLGSPQQYTAGDFRILDKGETFKLLNQLLGCYEALGYEPKGKFPVAMHNMMTNELYDHARMLKAFKLHAADLDLWARTKDYQRNIEEIYNFGYAEANKVRLF